MESSRTGNVDAGEQAPSSSAAPTPKPPKASPELQAERRAELHPLMRTWAKQGIPPYILALLRNAPPPEDPAERDEAWQMLAKLEKIFATKDKSNKEGS